jgi:16S rRNA (cytosine967-C5)-methyltransferase
MHRALLEAVCAALTRVLEFRHPADAVLGHYFREHRTLGQKDRAFIAEAVFGVLRHYRVFAHLAGDVTPRRLVLLWLVRFDDRDPGELSSLIRPREAEWLSAAKSASIDGLPPAVRAELPDWVWMHLKRHTSEAELLALGTALQAPAPLDLRVNLVRGSRPAVLEALEKSGVPARETPYSPVGVRLESKPVINRHPLFLSGAVEVQDEGSQLIGYLLAPRRRDLVVDFCAGAGGKSLMLGAMMQSQGRVYAFDISPARLERLKPRLKRSGLSNIHPHLLRSEHDPKVKRLSGKIDRVLVDAPCSGLGTLRRNPDLKWRQSAEGVGEMRSKQASILHAASRLVKMGGRLVYATCSLLREENEDIVGAFLDAEPAFALMPAGEVLKQQGIAVAMGDYLKLWPHVHGTDGFFAAVLERERG